MFSLSEPFDGLRAPTVAMLGIDIRVNGIGTGIDIGIGIATAAEALSARGLPRLMCEACFASFLAPLADLEMMFPSSSSENEKRETADVLEISWVREGRDDEDFVLRRRSVEGTVTTLVLALPVVVWSGSWGCCGRRGDWRDVSKA